MCSLFTRNRITAASAALLMLLLISTSTRAQKPLSPSGVLVVTNVNSPDSLAIGNYYVERRKIPRRNLLKISCPATEECTQAEFETQIRAVLKRSLGHGHEDIQCIVLTKGIPIRLKDGSQASYSIDSMLTAIDWNLLTGRIRNPFFAKDEHFSHQKFAMYLVCRLDGYTRRDCLRLIDNSLAALPAKGLFLFDVAPARDHSNYQMTNDWMRSAASRLKHSQFSVELELSERFIGRTQLMGYASWGSNDARYDSKAYHALTFLPGALAETAVSTSGRTFSNPRAPGQSLIADLIAQGVTGCKGYVSEPYIDSIAHTDALFVRYTSGYSLAESFYMASQYLFWKDVVIGDPLCAPYAAKKAKTISMERVRHGRGR